MAPLHCAARVTCMELVCLCAVQLSPLNVHNRTAVQSPSRPLPLGATYLQTAASAKRRRQPTKGVPGLPHLGRHEGSKGNAAAAGQRSSKDEDEGGVDHTH